MEYLRVGDVVAPGGFKPLQDFNDARAGVVVTYDQDALAGSGKSLSDFPDGHQCLGHALSVTVRIEQVMGVGIGEGKIAAQFWRKADGVAALWIAVKMLMPFLPAALCQFRPDLGYKPMFFQIGENGFHCPAFRADNDVVKLKPVEPASQGGDLPAPFGRQRPIILVGVVVGEVAHGFGMADEIDV